MAVAPLQVLQVTSKTEKSGMKLSRVDLNPLALLDAGVTFVDSTKRTSFIISPEEDEDREDPTCVKTNRIGSGSGKISSARANQWTVSLKRR